VRNRRTIVFSPERKKGEKKERLRGKGKKEKRGDLFRPIPVLTARSLLTGEKEKEGKKKTMGQVNSVCDRASRLVASGGGKGGGVLKKGGGETGEIPNRHEAFSQWKGRNEERGGEGEEAKSLSVRATPFAEKEGGKKDAQRGEKRKKGKREGGGNAWERV